MEAIYIPHLLKAPKRQAEIVINDRIARLDTLTPVKGIIAVRHGGNFLEVSAKAETITTLTCDRCLRNYNHRLVIDVSELIWLESEPETIEELPTEREVYLEDLSETLPPQGHFDPETWLFEQLSLALPLRKVCGADCAGAEVTSSQSQPDLDSRWAALAALKDQLGNN